MDAKEYALEIKKYRVSLVSALGAVALPVALAAIGFMTSSALQEREQAFALSEGVIEKRREIYESIRIPLNNIYCYIKEVGGYKKSTPLTIEQDRRLVHAAMHTQRAYWSSATFRVYLHYMDEVAFETWQGNNVSARIQDSPGQKATLSSWQAAWAERFTGEQHPDHDRVYGQLMDAIALDIAANTASR